MKTETIDYEQQAQAFLNRFGIKFRATLPRAKTLPGPGGRATLLCVTKP